jgi:hypothetical protein
MSKTLIQHTEYGQVLALGRRPLAMIFYLLSLGYEPARISNFFKLQQHLDARGLRNLDMTSATLSCSTIASMTLQHRHLHDSAFTSHHNRVRPTAPPPA